MMIPSQMSFVIPSQKPMPFVIPNPDSIKISIDRNYNNAYEYYYPRDITIGTDKYNHNSKIGHGGNGDIHKYICATTKQSIAVKVFYGEETEEETEKETEKAYTTEAKHVKYNIDCIVPAVAKDEYIIMECMTGNLNQYVRSISKEPDFGTKLSKMLSIVCDIVLKCYNAGIIHYDLKLDNFLYEINKNGELRIVLADFGGFITLIETETVQIGSYATYPPIHENTTPEQNIAWMLTIIILKTVCYDSKYDESLIGEIYPHTQIKIVNRSQFLDVLLCLLKFKKCPLHDIIMKMEEKAEQIMTISEVCEFVKSESLIEYLSQKFNTK